MNKLKFLISNIIGQVKALFAKRDKGVVLFGAWFGKRFADNTRYLFQYLSENKEKLGLKNVVWVSRERALVEELCQMGYEAYEMDSEESVYFHKKAYYHIICNTTVSGGGLDSDILSAYSCGAKRINLWHGLGGIKGVNFASREHLSFKKEHPFLCFLKEFLHSLRVYRVFAMLPGSWAECYYLSTTPFETEIFNKYFQMPKKYYIESGYPRNDVSYKLRESEKEVIDLIKTKNKTVLYMPTFRSSNDNFTPPLADSRLVRLFEEKGWLWIEKKHSADKTNLLNETESNAVLRLNFDFDANTILPFVDAVVTDYSSVSWDALYHSKPTVFYMPDYDYYMNSDRGFVLSPEEFLIGPAAKSADELLKVFSENAQDFSKMLPENEEEIFKKVWGRKMTCEEIWNDILKHLVK